MITVNNLSMQFGGQWLFQRVDLQFTAGNCYGIIGANGAGKSTFLRILSGELDSTSGAISIQPGVRMSVLKQDQFAYDAHTVLDTVIMGNERLYRVGKEKDALYEKPDFSDEDGLRASELEAEFAELGGWEAESDASQILQGLGVPTELHADAMAASLSSPWSFWRESRRQDFCWSTWHIWTRLACAGKIRTRNRLRRSATQAIPTAWSFAPAAKLRNVRWPWTIRRTCWGGWIRSRELYWTKGSTGCGPLAS